MISTKIMNKAIDLAKKSVDFKVRVGCVIVDKQNTIISIGYNQRKTHPVQSKCSNKAKKEKHYLHAEISALVKCRGTPHTLYIARLKRNNHVAIAKPCPVCRIAIVESKLKKIVYTTNTSNELGELLCRELLQL